MAVFSGPFGPWSVGRGLPALEHRRRVVVADRLRVGDPGTQLNLVELTVLLLELDAVGVARDEVLHQHLACELVLSALRDVEVDLEERIRIAVEHGRRVVLLEEANVLKPVCLL